MKCNERLFFEASICNQNVPMNETSIANGQNRLAFRQKKKILFSHEKTKPSIFQLLLQLFVDFICSFLSHHHIYCCKQQIVSENNVFAIKCRTLFDRLLFFPNRKEVTLRKWQLKC